MDPEILDLLDRPEDVVSRRQLIAADRRCSTTPKPAVVLRGHGLVVDSRPCRPGCAVG